jgi:F0F1-type ATP synthase beta subunit
MAEPIYGKVVQVIGPVIDVEYEPEDLPEIYTALELDEQHGDHHIKLTAEVQQHLGRNQVRAVSMQSTDGVVRGMKVLNTQAPISVPVGQECLGRVFNLLGEVVDHGEPVVTKDKRAIHQPAPRPRSSRPASRSSTCSAPSSGRQDRPLRRRGRRQDRHHPGADRPHRP